MGAVESWVELTEKIASAVGAFGMDLIHPFRIAWYDDAVEDGARLPGAARRDGLGVLVGNTRAAWPHIVAGMDRREEDPLDRWIEAAFADGLRKVPAISDVVFAHEPPPRRLPMQRLAVHAGFVPLSAGRLLAHPEYGPWFALRAVVVVDAPGPPGPAPRVAEPCAGCDAPCRPAFEHASRVADASVDHAVLRERWRPWLAVRDACPVGRAYRYSEAQIRFHYAHEWPADSAVADS